VDAGRWCRVLRARISLPLDPGAAACSRRFPIHNVKQRSLLRSWARCCARVLLLSFPSAPERGDGERREARTGSSVVTLARRDAALTKRGASRATGTAPLGAPPWRFSAARPRRVSPTVQPAPRCGFPRPGLSPGRSGPATSRACGSRRSRAGLPHPRSASERLRRRPSMSEDMRNVAEMRFEVNPVVACSQ
jgi:hypothetical protein